LSFLVFIDTNIFLDFYRVPGREKNLSILDHVGNNQERFIITSQVEMEFKKNRQKVILESYDNIKPPNLASLRQLPAFLSNSKQSSAAETLNIKLKKITSTLRERTERVLQNPTTSDPVYRAVQRLFKYKSPYNLDRSKKVRYKIRRLARKRYLLGYPPRKANDTSMGDAVNWEWIIHCAIESGQNVVVVTRDSDFGATYGKVTVLNDWLEQEFHKRVSKKRQIILTNRLSEGLKAAGIGVTKVEIDAEEEFLDSHTTYDVGDEIRSDPVADDILRMIRRFESFDSRVPDSSLRIFEQLRQAAEGPAEKLREMQEHFTGPVEKMLELQEQIRGPSEKLIEAARGPAEQLKEFQEQLKGPAEKFRELHEQMKGPAERIREQLDSMRIQFPKPDDDED